MHKKTPYARWNTQAAREFKLALRYKKLSHARLLAYLRDPSRTKRGAAVEALGRRRRSAAVLRDSMELCRNADPKLREYGAMILGELYFPDSPKGNDNWEKASALLHALATTDPRVCVRAEAMRALSKVGGETSLIQDAVEKTSREKSASVRVFAAHAIGHNRFPDAQDALLRLLRDPDNDVRDWAAFAVYMRADEELLTDEDREYICDSPEIRDILLELTRDPHDWVRYEAFRALGALREKRAAPLLAQELLGSKGGVYNEFAEAAAKIGDPSLIPVLESIIENFEDDMGYFKDALERLRQQEQAAAAATQGADGSVA